MADTPLERAPRPLYAAMDTRTLPERIVDEIRFAILRGEILPGEPLRQRDLATRFGTSLIPVREALRCLEHENVVQTHPYRGAVVTPLSTSELRESAELHHVLFSHVLPFAIPASGPEDADRAERVLAEVANVTDVVRAHDLLWTFHEALLLPAGRPHAVGFLRCLWVKYMRYWPSAWRLLKGRRLEGPDLESVLAAYRRKDTAMVIDQLRLRTESFVRLFAQEFEARQATGNGSASAPAARPRRASRARGSR